MKLNVCDECLAEGKLTMAAWNCKKPGGSFAQVLRFSMCHAHREAWKALSYDDALKRAVAAEGAANRMSHDAVQEAKGARKP